MEAVTTLLIQDSVFLLVVILARTLLHGHTRYRHIMLLWYAALIRFLIPIPLPSFIDLFIRPSRQSAYVPHETFAHSLSQSGASWLASSAGHFALTVWLLGAALLLAAQLVTYRRWIHAHPQIGPVDDPQIHAWVVAFVNDSRRSFTTRARIFLNLLAANRRHHVPPLPPSSPRPRKVPCSSMRLMWADNLASPVTCGCLSPIVLLPIGTAALDSDQKRRIIEHELTHIRRQDPLFKVLLTCVCCAFWFNPLVWAMRVLANRDIELACDEEVARFIDPAAKRSYAGLLLRFASSTHAAEPAGMAALSCGATSFLAMRIQALRTPAHSRALLPLLGCIAAIPLALALSTTGIANSANPWVVRTDAGSLSIPEAWFGKVEVFTARSCSGSELTFVSPIGQPDQPLVALGPLDAHLEATGSRHDTASLLAVVSRNQHVDALWGFDYSGAVSELPLGDGSIPSARAWQPSTGGGGVDSLGYLHEQVAPSFCAA